MAQFLEQDQLQLGLREKHLLQALPGKPIEPGGAYGLGRIDVAAAIGKPEQIARRPEGEDLPVSVVRVATDSHDSLIDEVDETGGLPFRVQMASAAPAVDNCCNALQALLLIARKQVDYENPLRGRFIERSRTNLKRPRFRTVARSRRSSEDIPCILQKHCTGLGRDEIHRISLPSRNAGWFAAYGSLELLLLGRLRSFASIGSTPQYLSNLYVCNV